MGQEQEQEQRPGVPVWQWVALIAIGAAVAALGAGATNKVPAATGAVLAVFGFAGWWWTLYRQSRNRT